MNSGQSPNSQAVFSLQQNTAILSSLANSLPDSYIFVLNQNLEIEFVTGPNMGRPPLELDRHLGEGIAEVFAGYAASTLVKMTKHYRGALNGQPTEFDITNGDDRQHHSVSPILGENAKVEKILCFVQHINKEQQALESLKESERHLREANRLAKIGYWELDVDALMFTFDDQFLTMLKLTPESLGGYTMPMADYGKAHLFEEDGPMLAAETQLALDTNDPNFSRYVEHRFIDGNGDLGYLAVRYFAVKDKHGRTVRTVGANLDITERKVAEQELKVLLDKMTNQNARLKDFSFMISHNIRSSVSNLMGLSELLADDPGNTSYIEALCNTVKELNITTKDITTLLTVADDLDSESLVDCNMQEVVDRFIKLNSSLINNGGIDIVSKLPTDMVVKSIPNYLDSIIHNLMSNAIKYGTNESSRKVVIGQESGAESVVYVKDFGDGIDLDKNGKRLFTLGARFNKEKEGSGLGLYMTKNQIESAGGKITVESTVGNGTKFCVFFNISG